MPNPGSIKIRKLERKEDYRNVDVRMVCIVNYENGKEKGLQLLNRINQIIQTGIFLQINFFLLCKNKGYIWRWKVIGATTHERGKISRIKTMLLRWNEYLLFNLICSIINNKNVNIKQHEK